MDNSPAFSALLDAIAPAPTPEMRPQPTDPAAPPLSCPEQALVAAVKGAHASQAPYACAWDGRLSFALRAPHGVVRVDLSAGMVQAYFVGPDSDDGIEYTVFPPDEVAEDLRRGGPPEPHQLAFMRALTCAMEPSLLMPRLRPVFDRRARAQAELASRQLPAASSYVDHIERAFARACAEVITRGAIGSPLYPGSVIYGHYFGLHVCRSISVSETKALAQAVKAITKSTEARQQAQMLNDTLLLNAPDWLDAASASLDQLSA